MIMLSKFSNFPNELSENDELREYELSGSDCIYSQGDRKQSRCHTLPGPTDPLDWP